MTTPELIGLAEREAARARPGDRDDARGEAVLALLRLAPGASGAEAECRARRAVTRLRFARRRREVPLRRDVPARPREAVAPGLPPMTATARKAFERNLVILAAVRQGVPGRLVARVMGISQSRVVTVCRELEALLSP